MYRRRWSIENLLRSLESVSSSEIRSLSQPRATLLAFGVSELAYNVLSVTATAVRIQHELETSEIELSPYCLAAEIRATYAGMMIAVSADLRHAYDRLTLNPVYTVIREGLANPERRCMCEGRGSDPRPCSI
ncbi:MAG: hypothetical protein ACN6OP_15675, partial [Pseudomonadales bacterium]